ncbi:hypothetical protein [Burkholderia ubonensis]|uniref:Uncharacterized protein n=1 Tax=Burkholderia ubonensis TaxID=101571 RepID=A0A1R1J7S7_9BURK|nr:hypothetical protein [Burkholderia ubonensis]OMG71387.1 hypothetical protein BW685_21330 [Burkholderia ubonensis]
MDVRALRQIIFDKMNMKVDEDDPFFALILLNEIVLNEALQQQAAALAPVIEELQKQSHAIRSALDQALARVEESRASAQRVIEGSGQREAASVRESVREAAFKAGVDGAAQAFEQFSKKKLDTLDSTVKAAQKEFGELAKAYSSLLTKTAEAAAIDEPKKAGSGGAWARALTCAVVAALLVLGGQWLLSNQSAARAQVSANDKQWAAALAKTWPSLPAQVQNEIRSALNQPTQ